MSTLTDEELLREVMNTVGKPGKAWRADQVRGVGLDAHGRVGREHGHAHSGGARLWHAVAVRTVVVGRGLRRMSYDAETHTVELDGAAFEFPGVSGGIRRGLWRTLRVYPGGRQSAKGSRACARHPRAKPD